ncbi:GntR family transcriptional regulator [Actinosynnema sp. ALI-1.44]|uniref:GntR family transcriptional regulator n=1 Tax=Actinosynnema sp. ALI-1.44 TaxID=1933779 RepID=UPI00097CB6DD|nr:GntR family transcriptional regulator [Actinosynnema sp. ALI-1.44]ONI77026.1 GntR family transcriptional regulator [Actinosynnema sp. ALI-1.44]
MLRPAGRRGLAEEAADRIRDAIFGGDFPPGSALREVDLAAQLDVSRGSVREGLAILEREGLVQSEWHRGTKVIDLTARDAEEVYSVRAALEGLAGRAAIGRVDLTALTRLVDTMAGGLADGVPSENLLALDIEFHDTIYQATANRRLIEAWYAVRSQVYLFQLTRIRLGHNEYRAVVVDEHRQMVKLLERGEAHAVTRFAEEHVHSALRALTEQLSP